MADPTKSPPLTRDSVIAAHALIKQYIHYTPVLTNATLTELASTPQSASALANTQWAGQEPAKPKIRLWFKCENLQKVGAFKVRGAFHALTRLVAEEGWEAGGGRGRGVVTHSSGNHAQALALAARTMGVPAHIVMPKISTPSKIAATKGYGAKIIFSGSTSTEREAVVEEVIKETGARLVPPYDHPDIMLGQGTLGIELQEQVARMIAEGGEGQPKCSFALKGHRGKRKGLDAIIAPCGGGGMLSGTAISCEGTGISVFGAEPSFEGADDCKRGVEQGKRIETVKTLTIADGLRTPVGAYPWSVIYERKLVRQMFSVTEDQIKKALRLVLERMKVVVEPSAVVGLATALFNEDFRQLIEQESGEEGWDLGIAFSGGNVSVEALGKMFEPPVAKAERQEGLVGVSGEKIAENVAGKKHQEKS
ncbi:tryptophan synthase beta subunit-like PLP-dependent enzyme [Hyaloscypha variabilis F]|uniref:Tryptophan synthase beta subunit-like PLP-dependent enzyme n=1 Tax=Hyaloscypha variabilis (strain UAMH 11265 / GT02V1 / F) TaxID=1149755 RepID=A0A2J6S088_HYAVF|nr:tryptophan synthase beta subunit-like PLP-dependent enzyme [Hyaloscypha variabilis F]